MSQTTFYEIPEDEIKKIENNFTYHAPFVDQAQRYEILRNMAKGFALQIMSSCPPSRERSIAITNLEQAMMWANASIARNEIPENLLPPEEKAPEDQL